MEHLFRNSAIGGFNRQDVMDYLEKLTVQNMNDVEEQRGRYEEAQKQLDETKRQLEKEQKTREKLEAERDELRRKLERVTAELIQTREACDKGNYVLEKANQKVESLQERLTRLEPDALAYAAIKDRTAGMELESHRRAQEVEQQAQEYARRLHDQMEQWLAAVERQYDELRDEVENTICAAASQLGKAGQALEQVTTLMEQQKLEMQLLEETYRDEVEEQESEQQKEALAAVEVKVGEVETVESAAATTVEVTQTAVTELESVHTAVGGTHQKIELTKV